MEVEVSPPLWMKSRYRRDEYKDAGWFSPRGRSYVPIGEIEGDIQPRRRVYGRGDSKQVQMSRQRHIIKEGSRPPAPSKVRSSNAVSRRKVYTHLSRKVRQADDRRKRCCNGGVAVQSAGDVKLPPLDLSLVKNALECSSVTTRRGKRRNKKSLLEERLDGLKTVRGMISDGHFDMAEDLYNKLEGMDASRQQIHSRRFRNIRFEEPEGDAGMNNARIRMSKELEQERGRREYDEGVEWYLYFCRRNGLNGSRACVSCVRTPRQGGRSVECVHSELGRSLVDAVLWEFVNRNGNSEWNFEGFFRWIVMGVPKLLLLVSDVQKLLLEIANSERFKGVSGTTLQVYFEKNGIPLASCFY